MIHPRFNVEGSDQRAGRSICQLEYKEMHVVTPSAHEVVKEETHQPAKIYRYEVSVVERPDPVPLSVYIYNQMLSCSASAAAKSRDETHTPHGRRR